MFCIILKIVKQFDLTLHLLNNRLIKWFGFIEKNSDEMFDEKHIFDQISEN